MHFEILEFEGVVLHMVGGFNTGQGSVVALDAGSLWVVRVLEIEPMGGMKLAFKKLSVCAYNN